jgi:ABC transporter substrate binding protein (PQQ-dependent alcohol dehydrogenase system)
MKRLAAALALAAFPAAALAEVQVTSAVVKVERERPLPISRLDLPVQDDGFAGARVGLADNATTGQFMGQKFDIIEITTSPADQLARVDEAIAQGATFLIVMASADDLLAIADHVRDRDVVVMNVEAPDDRLRGEDCRANVLHLAPNRAMLADGLAQYLIWKQWSDWMLISGSHERDVLKGDAF